MNFFDKVDDKRAQNGIGAQLNVWDDTLRKYKLYMPLESVPAVVGSTDTVEVDLLTSSMKTKIRGKSSVEDKDVEFLWHRDNLAILRETKGKKLKFLVSYPDFTGWKFEGEIVYRPNDATSDKLTGTFTIIANAVDEYETEDVRDMLAKTCFITSTVPSILEIGSTGQRVDLVATDSEATFTAESSSTNITAQVTAKSGTTPAFVTISKGNSATVGQTGIVTITASATGMASWKTTIAVEVTA